MRSTAIRRAEEIGWHGGRSLRELLARGERPDRATLVDWGCQLLEILSQEHARGVHRHVTEDEVIVTAEGRVTLCSLGLKRLWWDPRVPPTPEQIAGEPYTARSDLYAVGSLLRRLAFAGALHGGCGGLRSRDPLLKVLARATFTAPAGRYESAAEMADALREAGRAEVASRFRQRAAGAPSAARVTPFPLRLVPAPSSAPRLRDYANSDVWKVLLLVMALLLLVTSVLATGWFLQKKKPGWIAPPGFVASQTFNTSQGNLDPLLLPNSNTAGLQACGPSLRVTALPPLGFAALGAV